MMHLDLDELRTFIVVCEKQSLTEAASALGTTQPAISQRLKKLEEKTNARLLDRKLRPIVPTAAGQALLDRARLILAEVDKLEFELARHSSLPLPNLRLGITDALGSVLAPELVRAIKPSVHHLSIHVNDSNSLGKMLLDRELHAIVSSDPLTDYPNLDRCALYTEPMLLILPRTIPYDPDEGAAQLRKLSGSLPFVRYSNVSPLATHIETNLRRLGIQPPRDLEFNNSEVIGEMVRQHLGWAIMTPLCIMQARVDAKDVQIHALPAGGTRRTFNLLYHQAELGTLPHQLIQLCRSAITTRVVDPIVSDNPWLAPRLTVSTDIGHT